MYVMRLSLVGSWTYSKALGKTGSFYIEGSTIGKADAFASSLSVKIEVFIGVTFSLNS